MAVERTSSDIQFIFHRWKTLQNLVLSNVL